MMRVLAALCERPWATSPQVLDMMISIVQRHGKEDIEALQTRDGSPLRNTGGRVTMRGSVAQIDVVGPLFRYANLFTDCSGATSVENLAKDFQTALNSPQVSSVVLNINTPGGEADGIGEFATQVYKARGVKPVVAYVGGMAASGGYWIASAAERIVAHETAQLGSIGVVATLVDDTQAMEKVGLKKIEVVSSQSPDKRPAASSDQARALVQGTVDSMADIFIARVAQYRGVDAAHVMEHFGRGYTRVGAVALKAGMADSLGSLEELFGELSGEAMPAAAGVAAAASAVAFVATEEEGVMAEEKDLRLEERLRMKAILESQDAKGKAKLANYLALSTSMSVEEACAVLANAASEDRPDNQFVEQMRATANPVVGVRTEAGDGNDDDSEIAEVMKFVPSANRRPN